MCVYTCGAQSDLQVDLAIVLARDTYACEEEEVCETHQCLYAHDILVDHIPSLRSFDMAAQEKLSRRDAG